MKYAITK